MGNFRSCHDPFVKQWSTNKECLEVSWSISNNIHKNKYIHTAVLQLTLGQLWHFNTSHPLLFCYKTSPHMFTYTWNYCRNLRVEKVRKILWHDVFLFVHMVIQFVVWCLQLFTDDFGTPGTTIGSNFFLQICFLLILIFLWRSLCPSQEAAQTALQRRTHRRPLEIHVSWRRGNHENRGCHPKVDHISSVAFSSVILHKWSSFSECNDLY